MFERYSEKSRRVIFFARYEASQFGSMTIESEHLLLGLMREDKALFERLLSLSVRDLTDDVTKRLVSREKVSTSIDLPLSNECKRILAYAAEEAERLNRKTIGTESLLLGMLREEKCGAAEVLYQRQLKLDTVRSEFAKSLWEEESGGVIHDVRPFLFAFQHSPALPKSGVVNDAETAKRIAEAIWSSLFGAETVQAQAPIQVELQHNVWILHGNAAPDEALFIFMLQADGRILSIGRGAASA
jgi:hypothetical protein